MDHVSSLECLKLDFHSKVLLKDGGRKGLVSPDMVPLNYDTPILDSKAEEQTAAKQCLETPSPPPNYILQERLAKGGIVGSDSYASKVAEIMRSKQYYVEREVTWTPEAKWAPERARREIEIEEGVWVEVRGLSRRKCQGWQGPGYRHQLQMSRITSNN
ncbi:unnamed protein product [Prunus armeniaca]|uniref:Uncharacterized protein n=1 Tax=Prunus armeniaca TaxID=36596 RepID=A0A6J5X6U2_PRUAR|nr:unnamed protein product [Prunus armeniaca]